MQSLKDFKSAAGAFNQAKAYAESGRAMATKQFDKVDAKYQIQKKPAAEGGGPPSPGLPSAPPPPPPSRSSGGPPPPPGRGRAASGASVANGGGHGAGRIFAGIDATEKEAFFALLDEYFASRPHLAHLFNDSSSAPSAPPPVPTPAYAAAPPAPPLATRPPPAPVARGLGYATALYDFEAGQGEDLGFSEGDRIEVLEKIDADWYRGALNGREGIFPASYVQL